MLNQNFVLRLNEQINLEFFSSNLYLQMSGWADHHGFPGVAKFLDKHAEEEMMHMKRLFNYVKETGAMPMIGAIDEPRRDYDSLKDMFEYILEHEKLITRKINELAGLAFKSDDFSSFNFLQWYVAEQHEEESLFNELLSKLNLLGSDGKALYLFDKELLEISLTKVIDSI